MLLKDGYSVTTGPDGIIEVWEGGLLTRREAFILAFEKAGWTGLAQNLKDKDNRSHETTKDTM